MWVMLESRLHDDVNCASELFVAILNQDRVFWIRYDLVRITADMQQWDLGFDKRLPGYAMISKKRLHDLGNAAGWKDTRGEARFPKCAHVQELLYNE